MLLAKIIAASYKPTPIVDIKERFFIKNQNICLKNISFNEVINCITSNSGRTRIGIIFPTYVKRCDFSEFENSINSFSYQIRQIANELSDVDITVFVGIQYQGEEKEQAELRVNKAMNALCQGVPFEVVVSPLHVLGKNLTLNLFFKFTAPLQLAGMLWVDDDIVMGEKCLVNLIKAFLKNGHEGAFGAKKTPVKKNFKGSKFLYFVKQYTNSKSRQYPHGCCMIIASKYVTNGIPEKFMGIGEDGYFCFLLLDPSHKNPLHSLQIVPDTECKYCVGGPFNELYPRLKRTILHTLMLMAYFPSNVGNCYFREIWFYGFWPVGAYESGSNPLKLVLKYLFKTLYFLWVVLVWFELIIRGVFRIPMKTIKWGAYSHYITPSNTDLHA